MQVINPGRNGIRSPSHSLIGLALLFKPLLLQLSRNVVLRAKVCLSQISRPTPSPEGSVFVLLRSTLRVVFCLHRSVPHDALAYNDDYWNNIVCTNFVNSLSRKEVSE